MFISQERYPEVWQIPLETLYIDTKVTKTTNELKKGIITYLIRQITWNIVKYPMQFC